MSHDAEDEDDDQASKQGPQGDLLSQWRQCGLCFSWTVCAEKDLIHETDFFFVCKMSIPGNWGGGLNVFDSSVPRFVQPVPSDLSKF